MYHYTIGDTINLYERNYVQLMAVMPQMRKLDSSVVLLVGQFGRLCLDVLESSPYTSVVMLTYQLGSGDRWVKDPQITVRMYHDAKVAEVIAYQQHQYMRPWYHDMGETRAVSPEKRQVNLFLSEWLSHCLREGYQLVATQGANNN